MGDLEADEYRPVTILDVLAVDLCARAILDYVPVEELVRSERVSRRWRSAILHYLRTCRDLSYEGFCYPYNYLYCQELTTNHRAISIEYDIHSFPLVRKTLDKWGPYIMKVISDIGKGRYLDIIVSKCPNLEQIEIVISDYDERRLLPTLTPIKKVKQLKRVVLQQFYTKSKKNKLDLVLGELFQDINCENITICDNDKLTGSFLKLLRPDVLKSLTLKSCYSLSFSNLLSAIDNLRKITSMELTGYNHKGEFLTDVCLLLTQMSQLEELTLTGYSLSNTSFKAEWIHAFSQLGNLKRLTMEVNSGRGTDEFLEGLAQSCKNLECLKILKSTDSITARGVTALCRRRGRTTLHFPPWHEEDYASYFSKIEAMSLYKELAALGCFELTLEWFSVVCRDPHGWELPLNPAAEDDAKRLKLMILF